MTDEPEQPPSLSTKELILNAAPHWIQPKRESQYVEDYLRTNEQRGMDRGYTIGTYLAYQLRGKAKNYAGHYRRALERACERRVEAGVAVEGLSINGGIAYYPI